MDTDEKKWRVCRKRSQTTLNLDATETLVAARSAAINVGDNQRRFPHSLRSYLARNRSLWPLYFALTGTGVACLFGLGLHYMKALTKIARRRTRRIGFHQV